MSYGKIDVNSSALAMELCLFCTEPSICTRNVTILCASPCYQENFLSHIWNKCMESKVVKSAVLPPGATFTNMD